jgi:hypothetical protein
MKKQAVILGGIVIVAISSMSGTALSFLQDEQWSNYTQSWKTPLVIQSKKTVIAEEKTDQNRKDSIKVRITKR